MPNFISEDEIEAAMLQHLQLSYGYDVQDCFTADPADLNDGSRRTDKREVILHDRLRASVIDLNPDLPEAAIDDAIKQLCDRREVQSAIAANRQVDDLIRHRVQVEFKDATGRTRKARVKIIDFKNPAANQFLAVSQLWILGERGWRRPDILLYINGLPLVFIELKNSNVKLRTAYDDNLTNYKAEIPQLFLTNALCVFSNAIETRVGSLTAQWEHFFHWLRPEDEKEAIRREQVAAQGTSAERFLAGLCPKDRLLDYIENFILYHKDTQKIIAQNHQFIGVNRAYAAFLDRDGRGGRLGVFWHTQGSGKSFSMIFYVRKILRHCPGNFSFLVITDRDDLDGQIYRNFLNTGTVRKADMAQPKDSEQMRAFLGQNKRLVFTLIQKFGWPKGQRYPLLSDRDDIIVIVDEAHRTQYKALAENMRAGLPNAQYIAFTGTPLLGRGRKTNAWFGDYVSEYNFSQSMNDGATVPLFYSKRVPQVQNQNDDLSFEFYEILEEENLDPVAQAKLEQRFASELEVIKRDDRLETIARDIVYHFPRRGYLGKGMVIAVDKFTAVKMYDKVQRLWKEEIKALRGRIKQTPDELLAARLKRMLETMRKVEMAVVVSAENGEEEKFDLQGLDIRAHRKRMDHVDTNGHDLEYNFKDPDDPLQLVFVCAMWLTGFDAPTVSTLYLDKPQQDHTLMQTIARPNRVCAHKIGGVEKKNGEIVDYYGVFGRLKKALKDYGEGDQGDDEPPVKDKGELLRLLDEAIAQGSAFCSSINIPIDKALEGRDVFQKLGLFEGWANALLYKDEYRKAFSVYENTITGLYEAAKPEVLGRPVVRTVAVFQYLRGVVDSIIQQQDVDAAIRRVGELLDESLVVDDAGFAAARESGTVFRIARQGQSWDLSMIDFDKLREEFKQNAYKNIQIADLRAFLEKKLSDMLKQNRTRRDFAQRLQEIIDKYNAGSTSADADFAALVRFAQALREEEARHVRMGLSEDELEIYDLLCKDQMTKEEERRVRLAAKALLKRLTEGAPRVLVQDWFKDSQTRLAVRDEVGKVLDLNLPQEGYDKDLFTQKRDKVFELTLDLAINHRKWAA
ncbi:type I restriction endonuclease subunit R [uncultured Thiodictyon sp.]|uniref:type I restriction endonuclease subunit R n=1 Tax=uncultured Thiodictyon sp. TaxID=1846217 RepID=UPI0025F82BC7|nr:type I restriction endonuclease subunit R [uncultured Thiodictyon sp.]